MQWLLDEPCAGEEWGFFYRGHGARIPEYGAFTFAFAKRLRKAKRISFERLVSGTRDELQDFDYQQTPQILGPSRITSARVPWQD